MTRALSRQTTLALIALMVLVALLAFFSMRAPGGVGGTGIVGPGGVGGTGIFGRIDRFGSIWVNNREIFYDDNLPLIYRGASADPQEFALGQIVGVVADDKGGQWQASSARIIDEVIGPVEIAGDASVTVLKQKILFTEQTIFAEDLGETIEADDMVAISGFRTPEGAIIATRIDPVDFHAELHIRGAAVDIGAGGFAINDLEISYEGLTVAEGDVVAVRGALIGAQFTAYDVRKDGAFEGLGLENISYQGVVDADGEGSYLRVGEYSAANASIVTSSRDNGDYALVVLEGRAQPDTSVIDREVRASAIEEQFVAPAPETLRRSIGETDERNKTPEEVEVRQTETNEAANEAVRDVVDEVVNARSNGRQIDDAPAASIDDPAPQQDRINDDAREEPALAEPEEEATGDQAQTVDETSREADERDETEIVDDNDDAAATERPVDQADELERTESDVEALPAERPESPDQPFERPDRPERPEQVRPERPERPQRPNR